MKAVCLHVSPCSCSWSFSLLILVSSAETRSSNCLVRVHWMPVLLMTRFAVLVVTSYILASLCSAMQRCLLADSVCSCWMMLMKFSGVLHQLIFGLSVQTVKVLLKIHKGPVYRGLTFSCSVMVVFKSWSTWKLQKSSSQCHKNCKPTEMFSLHVINPPKHLTVTAAP